MTIKKATDDRVMKITPKYNINQVVYAVNVMFDSANDGKEQAEEDRDYVRIFKVRVIAIGIEVKGVDYVLQDTTTGVEWSDTVPEEHVAETPEGLIRYLIKEKWRL